MNNLDKALTASDVVNIYTEVLEEEAQRWAGNVVLYRYVFPLFVTIQASAVSRISARMKASMDANSKA